MKPRPTPKSIEFGPLLDRPRQEAGPKGDAINPPGGDPETRPDEFGPKGWKTGPKGGIK